MTLYSLKPRFQAGLRPLVHRLATIGVTANQVTLAAAAGSLAVGVYVALQAENRLAFLALPVWLFVRMALNAIDGMLAREHGQKSRLGAILNEVGDVVSDGALVLPFAFVPPFSAGWIGVVAFMAALTEFCGVQAATVGGVRRYDGPLGKSDRALVFGALAAWIGFGWPLPDGAVWLMPGLMALLAITCVRRSVAGLGGPAGRVEDGTPAGELASVRETTSDPARSPSSEEGVLHRLCHERTFLTHDGVELYYRHWPASVTPRGAIAMFHRGHEHSGRMAHMADEIDLPEFDVFAWDARGHGRSPGQRGYSPGFGTSVRDVQTFVDHLTSEHGFPPEKVAVVAQSVGAVLVATWLHDYATRVRAVVLASPAFKVKLYVPFARQGIAMMQRLRGTFFVNSYVKARFLTHDPERIASFESDPLITRPIASNVLLGLYAAAERVVEDAGAIVAPTQLLISGSDWVVHHGPQHRFFERLGSAIKERHVLPGFFHDTFGERDRAIAVAHARRFILSRFDQEPHDRNLLDADMVGHTRDEAERLATPLPGLSPKGLYWAATRASLRLGGRISEGVRLGHETGFDSGSTLDYVYRNEARGTGPLGHIVDRAYLDSIGWKGIRQRKLHVEEMIREGIGRLAAAGMPVRVLDVAAGHGRYVLEAIGNSDMRPDSILLRDYSELNVERGSALIADKGLGDVARFVRGDAFDQASVAGVRPRPTLAIVSGLFELFPENATISRTLSGLGDAVEDGGWLVYTNQPWHPQLELIARALTSHRGGQAWVMRRRTQAEMDQLVAAAGFRKVAQRIDEWGIFTVSLARRENPE